jgi:hypothetical protein
MPAEATPEYSSARRAYELGRLRFSAWRALLVASVVAVLGLATTGRDALLVLPITLLAWVFVFWRGRDLLRGAFYGLLGGMVTALLPLSILRPCCVAGVPPGKDCCTMPGACLAAGALVGMALAMLVPYGKGSWWRTACGVVLGMTSVAILKCATLFAGETVGLVGGLVAGLLASTAARRVLARRASA